jgi:glycosyltransferase involved in cell wall biosynthesis
VRIGVVPALSGHSGGRYQYSITMLEVLRRLAQEATELQGDEFSVFVREESHPLLSALEADGWQVHPLYPNRFENRARRAARRILVRSHLPSAFRGIISRRSRRRGDGAESVRFRARVARWLKASGCELMLYPSPDALSFETGIPYVMAIHDLQHRLQPEFPEVSADGVWEAREYLFRNGVRHATLLLADSEVGRQDILDQYTEVGATPEQVEVLPFLPASYLPESVPPAEVARVRGEYHLPERYLFYPAQFWPHKNHARIIEALALVKKRHAAALSLVLSGSHGDVLRRRTFEGLMEMARRLGVHAQILHLGYAPEGDMSALYAGAVALVMPTFFGPTNIPVLEAWRFGCPVVTSDIRGIREQIGDAGVLVDPRSTDSIAAGIWRIWVDDRLRSGLRRRGRERLEEYGPEDYAQRLLNILIKAKTLYKGDHEPAH